MEAVWRMESAKLIAGLARIVRDVSLAEDLAQDALLAALERWPTTGHAECGRLVDGHGEAPVDRPAPPHAPCWSASTSSSGTSWSSLQESQVPDLDAALERREKRVLRQGLQQG